MLVEDILHIRYYAIWFESMAFHLIFTKILWSQDHYIDFTEEKI